jgi:hypothetical protein
LSCSLDIHEHFVAACANVKITFVPHAPTDDLTNELTHDKTHDPTHDLTQNLTHELTSRDTDTRGNRPVPRRQDFRFGSRVWPAYRNAGDTDFVTLSREACSGSPPCQGE